MLAPTLEIDGNPLAGLQTSEREIGLFVVAYSLAGWLAGLCLGFEGERKAWLSLMCLGSLPPSFCNERTNGGLEIGAASWRTRLAARSNVGPGGK
ncbi:hypothetical protein VTL71DRAFT_6558 [Oculimacula yallundae]|uniref:Uncharacterized protein n=1 Tax=Oculimacula yallundae TaxID=86028 RepID=A0ABR4BXZ9_9HELO